MHIGGGSIGIPGDAASMGGGAIKFASFFTPGSVLLSVQSDLGVTIGTGVSAWADQSGNNNHLVQATPSAQPTLTAGLNGFPGVLFDGASSLLVSPLALPPSGTTPTFVWSVWRQITSNPGISIYCGTANPSHTLIATAAIQIIEYSGNSQNLETMTLNSWFRTEAYYSNSVADYLKVGSATSNTGSAGNLSGASYQLGNAGPIVSRYGNMEVLAWVVINSLPSAGILSNLSAAAVAKYGVSVGV